MNAHTKDIARIGTHSLWMSFEQATDENCSSREDENDCTVMDYLCLYAPPQPYEMN